MLSKLGGEFQQHRKHCIHHECLMLRPACCLLQVYLNKTKHNPWSVTFVFIPESFPFLRAHYVLYCNHLEVFKPLGGYWMTNWLPPILTTTERNIFAARQQRSVSLSFRYINLVQYWTTILPSSFRINTISHEACVYHIFIASSEYNLRAMLPTFQHFKKCRKVKVRTLKYW